MQNMLTQKVFWIAVIFLALLAIVTVLILRQFGAAKIQQNTPPIGADAGTVQVQDDDNVDRVVENQIIYTDKGFSPKEISLSVTRGLGCAVNLINKSSLPLSIGISPHKMPKDPGPDYPIIQPSKNFLFDPRFTGYTELRFHDHERPELDFLVKFEKSCR